MIAELDFNDTPRLDSVQPERAHSHERGGAHHPTDHSGYEDHGFGENYSFPILKYAPACQMARRLSRILYGR